MPIPDDFEAECLYTPEAWFIDDVLALDRDAGRVVARVDTTRLGPLVDAQRAVPGHPKHFPGAVAIQLTGTLGLLQAIYLRDLRPSAGWVGFGTTIRNARFLRIGTIGPPVIAAATLTRARSFRGTWLLTSEFEFTQDGATIYASEQTAAWFQGTRGDPGPA